MRRVISSSYHCHCNLIGSHHHLLQFRCTYQLSYRRRFYLLATSNVYDSFSVEPNIWVRWGHESESGQMVLKKVKLTYFDAYLWQTMWNHAKKSMEESKLSDSMFSQCDVRSSTQKLEKLKRKVLKILKRYDLSVVVLCERAHPEHSKNAVVF